MTFFQISVRKIQTINFLKYNDIIIARLNSTENQK